MEVVNVSFFSKYYKDVKRIYSNSFLKEDRIPIFVLNILSIFPPFSFKAWF